MERKVCTHGVSHLLWMVSPAETDWSIGGPSLSDSTPLLRSSASHILADGWCTLRFAALCAFFYTTLEGGRQPSST